jgi:hypothetical protein
VHGLGWLPIHYFLHLARIYRYSLLGNGVPYEFYAIQPEFAFGELSIKLVISQTLQNNSKVFDKFFFIFGIDQNIIDEDHYEFIELRHEYGVHEVHEVSWGICETEGHDQKLIETITSGEGGFGNVTKSNFDLMITGMEIDFGEDFGSSQLIKKNINSGKRIFVLNGYCIDRSVVNA